MTIIVSLTIQKSRLFGVHHDHHDRDSEVCIDQAIAGIVALGHDIVTCGESSVESFVTAMDISSALALECNVENDSQREFL